MNGLRVSLKRKKFYRLGEPIRVKLVIRNIVPRTVYLLKRSIGLGEIDNTGFRIVNEETGEELPYEGWLVKRKKISKESYQRLGFLKKYEIEVVIADNYALTATGKYALSLKKPLVYKKNLNNRQEAEISIAHNWIIDVRSGWKARNTIAQQRRMLSEIEDGEIIENGNYPDIILQSPCDKFAPQVTRAYDCMRKYLHRCTAELNELSEARKNENLHYRMVFGEYDKTRFQKVQTILGAVFNIPGEDFSFIYVGKCSDVDVIAYTYIDAKEIFFCEPFMECPITGEDSQAGTILHEMTHAAAGTDDYAYGWNECRKLAETAPDKAVNNADNYEFFAETVFMNRMAVVEMTDDGIDVGMFEYGGPAAVIYGKRKQVWIFYTGNDGKIYYIQYDNAMGTYGPPLEVVYGENVSVTALGHPQAVVYRQCLYLFYMEDFGLAYTMYTDDEGWSVPRNVWAKDLNSTGKYVRVQPIAVPVPVSYNDELHFAYCVKNDGGIYWLRYRTDTGFILDGRCLEGTLLGKYRYNPAACVYDQQLYVFYQNEKDDKGIEYTIITYKDGQYQLIQRQSKADLEIEKETVVIDKNEDGTEISIKTVLAILTGDKSEVSAVNAGDAVYLIYYDRITDPITGSLKREEGNTRQIQLSAGEINPKELIWTDFEKTLRSCPQGVMTGQFGTCTIAADDTFNYIVCQSPDGAAIRLFRQMRTQN